MFDIVKNNKMKKILILAYDFPPYVSVGALRPYSWYKYLHDFGVYPIVITRQWNNIYGNHLDYIAPGESNNKIIEKSEKATIIRTPYKPNLANKIMLKYGKDKFKIFRKIITAFYEIFQFLLFVGPKSKIYFAAKEYLNNNNVDTIIATGEPFILFKYASSLSKKYKIPWIADYRDPWSQNKTRSSNKIIKKWNEFNETRFLKNVTLITTVSEFCKFQISKKIKDKSFFIISNGFDDNIPNITKNIIQNNKVFSIGFAGTIYKWHPIESFLSVIEQTIKSKNYDIEINLYGVNDQNKLKQLIDKRSPDINKFIKLFPKISNDELNKELAKNNIVLLFNDYNIIGTKIFDYLAIKRKILLCYSNDIDALKLKDKFYILNETNSISQKIQGDLIQITQSGLVIKNTEHLYQVLEEIYNEFKTYGYIKCSSNGVEKYSRSQQTKKLAELVLSI